LIKFSGNVDGSLKPILGKRLYKGPTKDGQELTYNRKCRHSINSMTVSSHHNTVVYCDTGHTGRTHDTKIIENFLEDEEIKSIIKKGKYYFFGDKGFYGVQTYFVM